MMELPQSEIEDLKNVYKDEFNVSITDDQAKAEARRVLTFFHKMFVFVQENAILDKDGNLIGDKKESRANQKPSSEKTESGHQQTLL